MAVSRVRKALPRAIPVGVLRPRPIDLPARTRASVISHTQTTLAVAVRQATPRLRVSLLISSTRPLGRQDSRPVGSCRVRHDGIRIEWTTSCTVSDLSASAVPHLAFWASMAGRDAQRFLSGRLRLSLLGRSITLPGHVRGLPRRDTRQPILLAEAVGAMAAAGVSTC